MKVFISGGNRDAVLPVVEQALTAGHHVTALVSTSAKIRINHPNLNILKGDILRPQTFASSLQGQDVVISATDFSRVFLPKYNPTSSYSQVNACLLSWMEQYGVKRFFCVSPSEVMVSLALPWSIRVWVRYAIYKLLKHRYADVRRMEQIVRDSKADWTIIRPSRLTKRSRQPVSIGQQSTCISQGALKYRAQIWHML